MKLPIPEKTGSTRQVVVIGAGIGGLTTAALLLKAGMQVTVLEAHVYPGGSAGTFFHKGYLFDAGATLAGGFSPGGPHARLAELLGLKWPVQPLNPAWVVHLPNQVITQWADARRWQAERSRAFPGSEPFWKLQERLAAEAWQITNRYFPWPPSGINDLFHLAHAMRPSTLLASPYVWRTIGSLLPRSTRQDLRTFLDAQLLISAQTTTDYANALYGCAALDLPRRGVNYVCGGTGSLAKTLAAWIMSHGGKLLYRQKIEQIVVRAGRAVAVRTQKGAEFAGDLFIANLTPAGLEALLESGPPARIEKPAEQPPSWGAFTLYLGLNARSLPENLPDHHQVVVDPSRPLGEGNSIFISLSDPQDASRAPSGQRAATLSTHTNVQAWWDLARQDPGAYAHRKEMYIERCLDAAELAIPGLRKAVRLCLPGTPLTFQFFTRRPLGLVGGYPQTSLFQVNSPKTQLPNLWQVGDSIFPGQSTAGVTLGAMRTAQDILHRTPL